MKGYLKEPETQISRRHFGKICLESGFFFAVLGGFLPRVEAALRIGDIPPKFTLNDLKGNRFIFPDAFKGKVVLFHFWASWCPACRTEMASLESLNRVYGVKGVFPCSINLGEGKEAALRYIQNIKITYPVLLDPSSSMIRPFGISGIPTCYLLDRGNVVRFKILGEANKDGLEKMIRALL